MKIGRTNAITISGGGATKTPYDLWQEGFGANWDSVIQNAPTTNTKRVLHVYTKVDLIKLPGFPTSIAILIYNPTTAIYRPVTIGANKEIYFVDSDFFVNASDGLSYCCVIYAAAVDWGTYYFRTPLPVVYSNARYAASYDTYVNLIGDSIGLPYMPYLS